MTVNEAVEKLRELKHQLGEVEVCGELRGEHVYAVWHSKPWPRATEGALYLPAPSNPDIPPLKGNVNLSDDLYGAPAHHKSGREEEFSQRMVPAVTVIRKLFREAGRVVLRMPQLQALVTPIACGGQRSAIHVELEIWWFAALFRECSEPIQEHDYNDGGPEFETKLSCNVLAASDIVCDRFIEILTSVTELKGFQPSSTPALNSAATDPSELPNAANYTSSTALPNAAASIGDITINPSLALPDHVTKSLETIEAVLENKASAPSTMPMQSGSTEWPVSESPPYDENPNSPSQASLPNNALSVLAKLTGSELPKLVSILHDSTLSGEQKMDALLRADNGLRRFGSPEWAELLCVTPNAVRQYGVWKALKRQERDSE